MSEFNLTSLFIPRIIRAEFLSYYNSRRNSDKLFNVFVVEDDDGTFRCIAERGRRGTNLVRDVLCTGEARYVAEGKMRQKVFAKRNHRETPYTDETFGSNYSQLAREYGYNAVRSESGGTNQSSEATPVRVAATTPRKENVIEFPSEKKVKPRQQPKQSGILASNRNRAESSIKSNSIGWKFELSVWLQKRMHDLIPNSFRRRNDAGAHPSCAAHYPTDVQKSAKSASSRGLRLKDRSVRFRTVRHFFFECFAACGYLLTVKFCNNQFTVFYPYSDLIKVICGIKMCRKVCGFN